MSSWRASAYPSTGSRSVSVCTISTGTSRSVRIRTGAPRDRSRDRGGVADVARRQAAAAAAVDEEAVVHRRVGVHSVDVGGEGERRLRLADGHHLLDDELAERGRSAGSQRGADLAVDVVGEGVARVLERSVALGIEPFEALAGHPRRRPHRHRRRWPRPRPRSAGPRRRPTPRRCVRARGQAGPVRVGVEAAAHVEPLDHDRAREGGGISGPPHDDPRAVGGRGPRLEDDVPVGGHLTLVAERPGDTLGHDFDLDPALGGQVRSRGRTGDEDPVAAGELLAESGLRCPSGVVRGHRLTL